MKTVRGFTLVEVMMASVIAVTALLGFETLMQSARKMALRGLLDEAATYYATNDAAQMQARGFHGLPDPTGDTYVVVERTAEASKVPLYVPNSMARRTGRLIEGCLVTLVEWVTVIRDGAEVVLPIKKVTSVVYWDVHPPLGSLPVDSNLRRKYLAGFSHQSVVVSYVFLDYGYSP